MLKRLSFALVVLISVIFIFPSVCLAKEYTNNNGITMTEEEYNNFLKVHSKEYIMLMNEQQYEKLKTLNYDNLQKSTKFIESNYNAHLNLTTEKEITEEEFNAFNPIMPLLSDKFAWSETTSKRVDLTVSGGSYYNYVTVDVTWKGIPQTRSFDVVGIRGFGVGFRNGSQMGEQIYQLDGKWYKINYGIFNFVNCINTCII